MKRFSGACTSSLAIRGFRTMVAPMLSVAEAAERVGRSPETVRRWIRMGRLPAVTERGRHGIETADLDSIRDDLYPMLEMPDEWRVLDDGFPAPNWVAAIELTRRGR